MLHRIQGNADQNETCFKVNSFIIKTAIFTANRKADMSRNKVAGDLSGYRIYRINIKYSFIRYDFITKLLEELGPAAEGYVLFSILNPYLERVISKSCRFFEAVVIHF